MKCFACGKEVDCNLVALRFLLVRQVSRCKGGQGIDNRFRGFHSKLQNTENDFHREIWVTKLLGGHGRSGLTLQRIRLLHMAQGDGRPGNAIIAQNTLQPHVLFCQRLIGTAKRLVESSPGLILLVSTLPGESCLITCQPDGRVVDLQDTHSSRV